MRQKRWAKLIREQSQSGSFGECVLPGAWRHRSVPSMTGGRSLPGVSQCGRTRGGQRSDRPRCVTGRTDSHHLGGLAAYKHPAPMPGVVAPAGQRARVSLRHGLRHAKEFRRPAGTGDAVAGTGRFRRICSSSPTGGTTGSKFCIGVCHEASERLASCTEDGRRSPEVDFQESASNRPELLRSKGVVVNVRGKGARKGRQVSAEKMSEGEPSDDASSRIQGTVKTGVAQ